MVGFVFNRRRFICPPPQKIPHRCFGMAWSLCCLLLFVSMTPLPAMSGMQDGKGPVAGLQPLTDKGELQISPEDRCPVCAMKVAKHPKFACAIQLREGTTFYFCGPGCMIKSWRHPETFLRVKPDTLLRPVVRDYFSGMPLDARQATWVAGSDVIGPMGPAPVALKVQTQVEVFQKRHGGKHIFRLDDLTDERWKSIMAR